VIYVVGGASFDKKEFKRNVVGSVAYALLSTVVLLTIVQYFHLSILGSHVSTGYFENTTIVVFPRQTLYVPTEEL